MATFLMVGLVTILPWFEEQAAQAAPSKVKVFLSDARDTRVQRDCLAVLGTTLTAGIANTKQVVPARSVADADVVVQLKECRTASAPKVGGEIGVTARTGGLDRGVRVDSAVAGQLATVARVVLVVDDRGKPREFASEPLDRPLDEAARSATGSFLAWVKANLAR
jgi:hypothetical protein